MTREANPIVIAAGAVLLVLAVATVVFWLVIRPSTISDPDLIAIPTSEPVPPWAACHGALMEGELVAHSDWGLAVRGLDGQAGLVFWPYGYVARSRSGQVELLNGSGDVVARTGDWISAGGGNIDVDGVIGFRVCPSHGVDVLPRPMP